MCNTVKTPPMSVLGKHSRRIPEELGYELLSELSYADYADENGKKVFNSIAAEHKSVTVFGRKL